jgi:hypothetical protein
MMCKGVAAWMIMRADAGVTAPVPAMCAKCCVTMEASVVCCAASGCATEQHHPWRHNCATHPRVLTAAHMLCKPPSLNNTPHLLRAC